MSRHSIDKYWKPFAGDSKGLTQSALEREFGARAPVPDSKELRKSILSVTEKMPQYGQTESAVLPKASSSVSFKWRKFISELLLSRYASPAISASVIVLTAWVVLLGSAPEIEPKHASLVQLELDWQEHFLLQDELISLEL